MEKKLLSALFILTFFFLNPLEGFGQCPTTVGVTANPGTTICAGEEITFTANPTGGGDYTYQWQVNQVDVNGETASTFKSSSLTNNQKVRVIIRSNTEGSESCNTPSSEVSITVNPIRTVTVNIAANNANICPGTSINFTISAQTNIGSGSSYEWRVNDTSQGNGNTFTSNSLGAGDKVQLWVDSSVPCTEPVLSNEINITEKTGTPATPGTITGQTTVCPGATGLVYQINSVANATSYEWQLPTGWAGTSTANSITVTSGTTGNATIRVRAKNECGNSEFQTFNVTVQEATPLQPGTISGPTSVCPGVSADYSISAVARATEYVWTLPNGDEQITTIPNITVTTNTSGASSISVQAKNTCGISAKRNLIVSLKAGKPATPEAITGNAAVCPGISQTYSVAAVTGATSYSWTLPDGWTGNSTSRSITVTTGTTGGKISVIAKNDCENSDPQELTVTVNPGTPAVPEFVSPLTDVCPAETNVFTVNEVTGATGYIWALPSGWSGTSTTNTISITSANSGTGSISVQATNNCGTSAKKTIQVAIKPPKPTMTAAIQGPDNVCASTAGVTFIIPDVQFATEYVWSVPSGWSITNGQGSKTITVTSGSGPATISVKAKNNCGESVAATKNVTVTSGVPGQPGTITSSTLGNNLNICPMQEGIKFSVPAVTNATGYKWDLPTGWEITAGANTREITVKVNAAQTYSSPTSISVKATNVCGDSPERELDGIGIDSYILTNAGADVMVCKATTPITIAAEVTFGKNDFTPTLKATGRTNNTGFVVHTGPNGKVNGSFSFTYTPIQADIDRGNVTITLSVPKPSGKDSSCGTGVDEMIINFRNAPAASIATPDAICTGASTTLTITGTPNSKVTYSKGTQTGLTVDIGSSGTATIESGTLTANTTFTLTGIINLDSPSCSNSNLSSSATVTVTEKPTVTVSYDGPYCSSMATSTGAANLQGENEFSGGVFSANGDLGTEIDAEDGSFIPANVDSGTYTVTYTTPASGGCGAVSTTTEVTITPLPTAAIAYQSPFCSSDSADKLVTLTGTNAYTGGTYSSTTGLTIDASTGVIKAGSSTPGNYTVTYSLPAASGCGLVEVTTQVTITEIPVPVISYTQEQICKEDTNTYSATVAGSGKVTGGTFSAPAGLSISSGGVITPSTSTPGTYKVTYTLSPANGCGEITAETDITITRVPSVNISYAGPFCESTSGSKNVSFANGVGAYENGSFAVSPSGLTIDSATGAITPSSSTAGDYTVTYTIPASQGCISKTAVTTVNITAVPGATLSYPAASFCNADTSTYDISYSNTKGSYENGTFTGTAGLIIDSSSGTITPQGSTPGTHTITYTIPTADGCESVTTSVNIEIINSVLITSQPFNVGKCAGEMAKLEVVAEGTNLTYQWYHNGSIISGATSKILEFSAVDPDDRGEYYVEVSGSSPCSLVTSETVSLNVDENIELSSTPENKELCVGDSTTFTVEATANGGAVEYQWMRNGEELTGEKSNSLVLNNISLEDDGEYSVSLKGPDGYNCSTLTYIAGNLNVYEKPIPVAGNDITICYTNGAIAITDGASVEHASSISWTSDGTGEIDRTDEITGATYTPGDNETGTVTLTLRANGNSTCAFVEVQKKLLIERLPVITSFTYSASEYCETDTTDFTPTFTVANGIGGSFSVTPSSGLDLNTATGQISPNSSTVGVYQVTYTASNPTGCSTEVSETVSVEIGAKPVPDFEYDNTEYCTNSTDPILSYNNGGVAGSFSATPAGLSINNSTGAIDLANSDGGTYTVTNTIAAANGCQMEDHSFDLTVTELPVATISYGESAYCETDSNTYNVTLNGSNNGGGNYSISPATGLTMNASGQISPNGATVGDYTITYTIPASGGCEQVVATTEVEISPEPVGEFEYASTEYCSSATDPSPQFINGGVAGTFTGTAGLSIASNGTIDLSASTLGAHTVTNTIASTGGCAPVIETFNIYIEEYVAGGAPLIGYAEDEFGDRFTPVGEETNQILACHDGFGEMYLPSDFNAANVARWEYSQNNGTTWTPVPAMSGRPAGNAGYINYEFKGLSGLTTYRVLLDSDPSSNACSPVYSAYAFVSVIPADLKPNPVSVSDDEFCMGGSSAFSSTIDAGGDELNSDGGFQTGQLNPNDPKSWLIDGEIRGWTASGNNRKTNQWSGTNAHTFQGEPFNSGDPKFGITYGNDINNQENDPPYYWNNPYDSNPNPVLSTSIESPQFSLLGFQNPTFEFDEAYKISQGGAAIIEISLDCGNTYQQIPDNLIDGDDRTTATMQHTSGQPIQSGNYSNFGNGTNHTIVDLSPYFGNTCVRIRLTIVRTPNSIWAVDNFALPRNNGATQVQWTDQFDNTLNPISGTNNIIYTPETPGNQTFTVTSFINGCRSLAPEGSEDVQLEVHYANSGFDIIVDQSECGSSAKLHAYDNSKTPLQNYIDYNIAGLWDANAPVFTIIDNDPTPNGNEVWDVASTDDINKHGRELLDSNGNGTGKFIYSVTTLDNSNGVLPAGTYRDYGPTNANQYWSIVSGPSGLGITWATVDPADYFSDVNDAQAEFFGPGGSYVLRWTVEGNNGIECFDDVAVILSNCTTLDFDGIDDVVIIENAFTGVKAFEAWIRPEIAEGTIISGPTFEITTPSGITPGGKWYHLAVIYDGADKGLYIDGVFKSDPPSGIGGGTRTSIGAKWTSADTEATDHFSGWIEEVRIWKNAPTLKELRFMMNQRLKLTGTGPEAKVVTPLEGEIVPNKPIAGSYYTANGFNLDQDGVAFYDQTADDLFAYYRLISDVPDPTLGIIANIYKPVNGNTPDLSLSGIPGRLYNMETNQQNTSPTPYFSGANGAWDTPGTWARSVWNLPNSSGEWNIVRISHNINYGGDITVLGLISEINTLEMEGTNPNSHSTGGTGNPLIVTHYLDLNGNIDLNGESQLLQNHGSILAESSQGYVERDQQGKKNSFVYNYWSSPVSTQNEPNNSGYTVESILHNPKGDIEYVFDPFAADATSENATDLIISSYWLYTFKPGAANVYAEWDLMKETGKILSGEGFTMKGTSGSASMASAQEYNFRGKPHNGNITLTDFGANNNYLIGNPYPSAFDSHQFIRDNLENGNDFDGSLYFWDHFAVTTHILKDYIGGYAYLNLTDIKATPAISNDERINSEGGAGEKLPQRFIPVGQSFMISSGSIPGIDFSGGPVQFNNVQRNYVPEGDGSIFLKPEVVVKGKNASSENDMKIRMSFKSPLGYNRQILVGAIASTTNGFDAGYDAPLKENNLEDMYWIQGYHWFVIQGVPHFNLDQVLPLGITVKGEGEFSFKIDELKNFPAEKNVYIKDKLNDTIHDLRKEPYVSTSKPGYIEDRFEIVFFNDKIEIPVELPTEEPDDMMKEFGISIRHAHRERELQILNPLELDLTNMYIFDLNGNKLEEHRELPDGKEFRMPVRGYSSGVYVVQVVVEGRVVSKKIIINN